MTDIYICPPCRQPVVDQPSHLWTRPYHPADGWRHVSDDSPLCPDPATGAPATPAPERSSDLPDPEAQAWLHTMADLFTPVGGYNPARTATALHAVEALTRWLHAATGPAAAAQAIPTPGDVARLLGHLHRITRLLARATAQTGEHLRNLVRHSPLAQASRDGRTVRDDLDAAAHGLADTAGLTGRAWTAARRAAEVASPRNDHDHPLGGPPPA